MSATTKSYQIQSVQTSQILVEHPSGGPRVKTTLDRGIHVCRFHVILPFTNVDNISHRSPLKSSLLLPLLELLPVSFKAVMGFTSDPDPENTYVPYSIVVGDSYSKYDTKHIVWSKESYKWQVAPIGKNYQ